jgi:TRAP transporter TAXI family solute receptor
MLLLLAFASGCSAPGSTQAAAAAVDAATPASRQPVVLLTGPSGGAYSPLGEALADIYNAKLSSVHVTATSADGPQGAAANARAIEDGKAQLAFSRADLAFRQFQQSQEERQSSHLRSIAVVYTNVVHLLVNRKSGITRGEDIGGHRVMVGEESLGGGLARIVVEGHGVSLSDVTTVSNARDAFTRLRAGTLDVRIFASGYPLAGIEDVGPGSPIALLPLSPAAIERMRSGFPFFKPAVIPKGTYKGQEADVQTVGIDGLLLCHESIPESVVYDLTRTLFSALPDLVKTETSARLINAVNAPATPVPLHAGAARYYRERDLFR